MGLANISNAIRHDKSSGEPLPDVWKSLTAATAVFRRGQIVVIGGAPGTGKSAFALTLLIKSGCRSIYFSADSGPGTQLVRSVSILTGREVSEVQEAMDKGAAFDDYLKPVSRIWWEFDAGPTLESIEESVRAYSYLGAYPEIICIDNLLNVDLGESTAQEYQNVENVLLFCQELARTTGACVIVLAHLTGEFEDGTKPPPLGALRGKGGKIPEMVLNIYREESPMGVDLGVAIVKNRGGTASAACGHTVSLKLDLSRMLIEDMN